MADLLASNVTVIESWTTGSPTGKRNKVKRVKWTGTTAGGTTNKLVASALGMTKIYNVSNVFFDATTKAVYPSAVAPDGTYFVLFNPNQATDASRTTPADLATSTDYAYATVEGF